MGIDLRGGVGGGKGQVTSEPPAWLSPLFKPWSRMLCAAAAVAAAAAAPAHEVATVVCVRIVVRPRLPGHAVALIGSTSCGAQITTGTAQLRSAPATLVLPAPLNVASPTPVSPVSLHSLLVLGAPPPMRARLFRMLLSLPFPAIVRASQAAQDRLEAAKGAAEAQQAVDADPPFAPWSVKLVPDRHPVCGARLVVTVRGQLQQQTAGSLGDKSASSFASRLCLNESDEDGEEGDSTGGDIEADASASATPASPSPYDVHLAEMWSALASQLAPLDTASGVAPTASGGVTTPATVSSGAPPASAFVHASGRFSLVAHAVGSGALPLLLARAFPHATLLALDGSGAAAADAHLAAALRSGAANDVIGRSPFDTETLSRFAASPEFARFQLVNADILSLLLPPPSPSSPSTCCSPLLPRYTGLNRAGGLLATSFALAATTFVRAPPAALLSLAFTTFADTEAYPPPPSTYTAWVSADETGAEQHCFVSPFVADPAGLAARYAQAAQQQQHQEIQASGMGSLPYYRGSHLCDALLPRGLCRTTLEHPSKVLKLP